MPPKNCGGTRRSSPADPRPRKFFLRRSPPTRTPASRKKAPAYCPAAASKRRQPLFPPGNRRPFPPASRHSSGADAPDPSPAPPGRAPGHSDPARRCTRTQAAGIPCSALCHLPETPNWIPHVPAQSIAGKTMPHVLLRNSRATAPSAAADLLPWRRAD